MDSATLMERIGRQIRLARESAGFTQLQLGQRIGYSKSTVSKWENGDNPIGIEDLKKVADATGRPLSFFIADDFDGMRLDSKFADVMTHLNFTVIPIYGVVSAGAPVFVMDKPMDYLTVPRELLDHATFGIKVRGDSMSGIGIQDGDTLLVRSQDTAEPGDIVVARLNGEEYTIKQLAVKGGKYVLEPAHPAYSTIEDEFVIVGKVVSMLRRF